ncbi:hypothetical protein V9T40_009126 [Parthenolecanium corni]|uniref:Farnesol dehydrogenase n=1 Tax=Parthenolecanium corni TaxID=536013 RepID=A0AAN9Y8R6_9HEMI
MERFRGKSAIVSGSGAGIGAATAEELLKAGINVVGLDMNEEKLQVVNKKLNSKGYSGKFFWKKCNVCLKEDIVETFKFVNDLIGPVWVLINCAGVLPRTSLLDADTEKIDKTFDTNVKGLLLCAQEAIKYMIQNSVEGHVININSINGHYIRNRPEISETMIYAASKHAVTVLTEGLRQEMVKRNIKIKFTSISPGGVETELTASETRPKPADTQVLQPVHVAQACIAALNTPPNVLVRIFHILLLRK